MDLSSSDVTAAVASGLQASDITAIAGVFVAVFALGTSLWQARKSHLHSLVSVKPILEVIYHDHNELDLKIYKFSLFINNVGLGPAKITSMKFLIDQIEVDLQELQTYTNSISGILDKLNIPMTYIIRRAAPLRKGYILRSNVDDCFLQIEISEIHKKTLKNEMCRIGLHIEYEDFFGNRQPPITYLNLNQTLT
jgi:hypothetical protein